MVDVDKAVIARLKVQGKIFEILVDCEKALAHKEGKAQISDALATNDIFSDVKQGEKASEKEMEKLFGTSEPEKVAEEIIKKGEIQLTGEHRKKLGEEKKKKIISIIHTNTVDAQTGLPHPPQRIENALEEAKVKIDEFKTAEEQIHEVIKQLRSILPIKFEVREIAVKIPAQYAAKSYRPLKEFGKLLKDQWQNDGSLIAVVEIPAGLQDEFFSELNKLTRGEAETKLLNRK